MLTPNEEEPEEAAPQTRGEKTFLVIFTSLVLGLFALELLRDFGPSRMAAVFFLAAWLILTVIHEIAHAVVARVVGWRVHRLRIGFGSIVTQRVIQGIPVELRLFPIVGLVEITPGNLRSPRLKNALIYAAGPAAELAAASLLTAIVGWDNMTGDTTSYAIAAAQAFAVAALFGAGLNLLPFSPNPGTVTDGMGILMSPFLPQLHFEQLMLKPVMDKGVELLDSGRAQEAKRLFGQVLEQRPDMLLAHAGLARAQVDLGHGEYALSEFQVLVQNVSADRKLEAERMLEHLRAYIREKTH